MLNLPLLAQWLAARAAPFVGETESQLDDLEADRNASPVARPHTTQPRRPPPRIKLGGGLFSLEKLTGAPGRGSVSCAAGNSGDAFGRPWSQSKCGSTWGSGVGGAVFGQADSSLRFQVLGPVRVFRGTEPVAIEGVRQRGVLVVLLSAHRRPVPPAALLDVVWGEAAIAGLADPAGSLEVAVAALRRQLNDPSAARIKRDEPGYVIVADDDACDSWRFASLRQTAQDADRAGDRTAASAAYARALDEWTGNALSDLRGMRFADDLATVLDEARLATVEAKLEADLARGAHHEAVETADAYATANPTREGLHLSWMVALYRDGRRDDALAVYERLRDALHARLGIEPGSAAQRLHAAILRQDPVLGVPSGSRLVSPPGDPDRGSTTTVVVDIGAAHGGSLVDGQGRVFTLSGNRVTIGREADNDLVVSTSRTSRHHALLELTPLGWRVVDLGSSNGTVLNGEPIQTQLARDGDLLNIGGMLFRFVF